MRLIALEEHYHAPSVSQALANAGRPKPPPESFVARLQGKLDDLGAGRLADMDAGGIAVQVVSQGSPGTEQLEPGLAVPIARQANDYLAERVAKHPDRLAAFATLPTAAPEHAAEELERTVTEHGFRGALINGHVRGRFLDDRAFWPIFARAEALDVPIYLHPTEPPPAVRTAYYDGLPDRFGDILAGNAWGWHVDTGLHVLRLIAGGVLDEYPELQIIVGHMGEALPYFLARSSRNLQRQAGLTRPLDHYMIENFHFTTSGMFSYPPLRCLLDVIGADRVMFSVDYPFAQNEEGRDFITGAPISESDREKLAHGNAERLLRLDRSP
ncbi:MAG: amidohydrolase [Solirubrobacterales bacterium]|nr:amidohydrolase [Solirubrobacterales bacterium]